jgi:predicted transcriptional regulator
MDKNKIDLSELLFELSNEQRLKILNILSCHNQNLKDFSKNMTIPKPEIYRNLKRLISAGIIYKDNKNDYALTTSGKIIMSQLQNFLFLENYSNILENHDLNFIPIQFQASIGELKNIKIVEGTIEGFNLTVERFGKSQTYEHIMTKEIFTSFIEPIKKMIERGVEIRLLLQRNAEKEFFEVLESIAYKRNGKIKARFVDTVEMAILVDKKSGEFNIPFSNGEIDYSTTFYAERENEINWVNSLFKYYWDHKTGDIEIIL